MAVITQPNGPRARLSVGRHRNTIQDLASKQDATAKLGLTRGGKELDYTAAIERMRSARRPPTAGASSPSTPSQSSLGFQSQASQTQGNTTNTLLATLLAASSAAGGAPKPGTVPRGVRAQLIQGFRDAGRADLAKMVRTKAFDTWIGQESGWDFSAVSPANNQGMPNGGGFQFWYGHDFTNKYEGAKNFKASPYEQAQLVAKYFSHLDPEDIRRYARMIRKGTYEGWG
jgi:hypothetical protein